VALDGFASAKAALAAATVWAPRADARLAGVFVEDEMRFFFLPTFTYAQVAFHQGTIIVPDRLGPSWGLSPLSISWRGGA
jgi:ADP-ribose pyrophosphatase YjhB (NUDIX family)